MKLQEQTEQLKQEVLIRMPAPIVETFQKDIVKLKNDRLKEHALQVGDTVSNSILRNSEGHEIDLKSIHTSNFLILNFYRGGWCPYCNMELREYERLKGQFNSIKANIVGISAELPQQGAKTHAKNALTYPILTDVDAAFMKKMGIVFTLSEQAKKDFVGFGVDFSNIHGNEDYQLPVPAIYVIDKEFKILFIHFEEDYMTRLEPSKLLTILKTKQFKFYRYENK